MLYGLGFGGWLFWFVIIWFGGSFVCRFLILILVCCSWVFLELGNLLLGLFKFVGLL